MRDIVCSDYTYDEDIHPHPYDQQKYLFIISQIFLIIRRHARTCNVVVCVALCIFLFIN